MIGSDLEAPTVHTQNLHAALLCVLRNEAFRRRRAGATHARAAHLVPHLRAYGAAEPFLQELQVPVRTLLGVLFNRSAHSFAVCGIYFCLFIERWVTCRLFLVQTHPKCLIMVYNY